MKKILLTGYILLVSTFGFSQYFLNADTTVNGTWNLNGGILKVAQGVKIHGTGAVTNFYMDAFYRQNIFDTTINFNGILGSVTGKISSIWFGVSASNTDNTRYFQRAIDASINKNTTLYTPYGTYNDSSAIVIQNFNSGNFQNVQLIFSGDYIMNGAMYGTIIKCNNAGNFAIGIQYGKGVVISGIYLRGRFVSPSGANPTNYYNTTYANYTDANGVCTNYYTGIALDPYTPTAGTSGSTNIIIENCYITGFTNCINISCGGTFNDELITVRYVSFGQCRVCVKSNKGQEKLNVIEHCMAWDPAFCFFEAGYTNGQAGYYHITDINIAGSMVQVFRVNQQGWFPLKADHIYAEEVGSIGELLNNGAPYSMGIDISNSTFEFKDHAVIGQHYLAYTNNTNIIFRSCDFTFFNGSHIRQLPFNGPCTFDNCSFDGVYSNVASGSVFYPNCKFRN